MKRFLMLLFSIWRQRFRMYLAGAVMGMLFGVFVLEPINDFVDYHEHQIALIEPSVIQYVINELIKSLNGQTPEKAIFYAQFGAILGIVIVWLYGLLHQRIHRMEQLKEEINKDLSSTIRQGESDILEFKSSFRWDMEQNRVNRSLEGVIMKTLAGFMNCRSGGTLLIGVADNGDILGLEHDYQTLKRQDQDGFEQAVITAISSVLGADLCRNVKILFHVAEGKEVCRLIILPASRPVFFKQGKEPKFYLRTGGGTRELNIQEAVEFISKRWQK